MIPPPGQPSAWDQRSLPGGICRSGARQLRVNPKITLTWATRGLLGLKIGVHLFEPHGASRGFFRQNRGYRPSALYNVTPFLIWSYVLASTDNRVIRLKT